MKRRAGFTLIEILVVLGIILVLVAILFPVLNAARQRAKLTSCEANLYQYSRGGEMSDTSAQQDVSHCPYPQGDDDGAYVDVSGNFKQNGDDVQPDGSTVVAYCVEHLKRGSATAFAIPLEGKFPVARYAHAVGLVDAKGVTRWQKQGSKWVQVAETGEVPVYPTIWHFPGDDFPP